MRRETFYSQIADRLGGPVGTILRRAAAVNPDFVREVTEIRMRAGRPLAARMRTTRIFLGDSGDAVPAARGYAVQEQELTAMIARICQHSRYAYAEEMRSGYITVPGGHRIGIAGKMIADGTITDISSLNLRISREIRGACAAVLPYLMRGDSDVYSTLVISPPACGKTTLIRDLARVLSSGSERMHCVGMDVGIVDERSEIAACYHAVPSNDLGLCTDVYDGCPKARGILMMIRCMSPSVILTDELGGADDLDALTQATNAGVRIIATAHGYGVNRTALRPEIQRILEAGLFERYVVLSRACGPGTLESVSGPQLECLYERRRAV